jgi:hypothetical protein
VLEFLHGCVDRQLGYGVLRREVPERRDLGADRELTGADATNDVFPDLGAQRDSAVLIDRHGDRLPTT